MSPTIAQQRTGEGAQGLVVRRRNQWGAKRAYTDARAVDFCTRLFFHITVTNPSNYLNNDRHAQGVEAIGIARFPNTGVSYTMMVMPNAAIYEAQPLGRRGAHTVNDFKRASCTTTGCPSRGQSLTAPNRNWNLNFNARAVAICQNVQHPVTVAQAQAVARIGAAWKRAGFVHRQARWHGHRCVSSKSCPGNLGWQRMKMIHDLTESYTVNGLPGTPPPPPPPPKEDPMSEEVVLSALRKFAKERQSVVGLAADTLPEGWNTSLFYLSAYGAMAASPTGRIRQAADVWNYPNAQQVVAELAALREAVGEILEHDPSNPLTKADLEEAIERGMQRVRVEVSVVENDDTDDNAE